MSPPLDSLLQPIGGENPSGVSLRYDRLWDQIREARTEEDDTLPAGAWQRQAKKADFRQVVKLAEEALARRTKDLQIAAWLVEARVKLEGVVAVGPGLDLLRRLQETFWDTVHPELEDGDPEMRATPLEWIANRIAALLGETEITTAGATWLDYQEARRIGREADATNEVKEKQYRAAVAEGRLVLEQFDQQFAATPKSFYAELSAALEDADRALGELSDFCDARFGDLGPSFGRLRTALEELRNSTGILLNQKRATEPDAPPPRVEPERPAEPEPLPPAPVVAPAPAAVAVSAVSAVAAAPAMKVAAQSAGQAEPSSWEEAVARVMDVAEYMRRQRPGSAVPYMLRFSVRSGELRAKGRQTPPDLLTAPSDEVRQRLRRLAEEGRWDDLIEASQQVLSTPAGRGWLDPHRCIWQACVEMDSYAALRGAVVAALRSLLSDYPELPNATLDDGTPAADDDTLRWIEESVAPAVEAASAPAAPVQPSPPPSPWAAMEPVRPVEAEGGTDDPYATALEHLQGGRASEAVALLAREASRERSGRGRFLRRVQLAQICAAAGLDSLAGPVVRALCTELDERRLDQWEDAETIGPPIFLLLRWLDRQGGGSEERARWFERLCLIDPARAIEAAP